MTKEQYEAMLEEVCRLRMQSRDPGLSPLTAEQTSHLQELEMEIDDYEQEHFPLGKPEAVDPEVREWIWARVVKTVRGAVRKSGE